MTIRTSGVRPRGSADGIELLRAVGAVLGPGCRCLGTPVITFEDHGVTGDDAVDMAAFAGRIVLCGDVISTDDGALPGGPTRFFIGRWGPGSDDLGKITVGRTNLNSTSIVSYVGVTIGDGVHLDPRVIIMDTDGHPVDRMQPDVVENKKRAPVRIEDHAWIGHGAVILKGVTIGHHAVVLPGAVVMWDVPPHGRVIGNPAKNAKIFAGRTSAPVTV